MLPVVRRQRLHEINIRSLLDGSFLAPCVVFVLFFSGITGSAGRKITQGQTQTLSQMKKLVLSVLCQKAFVCLFVCFFLPSRWWQVGVDAVRLVGTSMILTSSAFWMFLSVFVSAAVPRIHVSMDALLRLTYWCFFALTRPQKCTW